LAADAGRILAVDPGEARIGLAITDALGIGARPLNPLASAGAKRDAVAVAEVARQQGAVRVVVGLPLLLSGEEGERAAASRKLVARLRGLLPGVEVLSWNEQLTTVEAEQQLAQRGVRGEALKRQIDGMAAVVLLRDYLDSGAVS
jgi:putative Holliday junction resolvase